MVEAVYRNLDDLNLWDRNYNRGDVPKIKASVRRFGFNNAVRVWRNNTVMAGNHSTIALRKLRDEGWSPVGGAVRLTESGGWEVLTVDLSHLPQIEAEAFAVADNHIAAQAEPDTELLAALLRELQNDAPEAFAATGYDDAALDALLAGETATDTDGKESNQNVDVEYCTCPNCGHRFPNRKVNQ